MVYRHIHGSLINIFTKEVKDTGQGYLSSGYTSQYFEPISKEPKSVKLFYKDIFVPIGKKEQWVLQSRTIKKENSNGIDSENETFIFSDLYLISDQNQNQNQNLL